MSDTPRTDGVERCACLFTGSADVVNANFARELEREVTELSLAIAAERSRANNLAAQLNAAESANAVLSGRLADGINGAIAIGDLKDALAAEKARADAAESRVSVLVKGENQSPILLSELTESCRDLKAERDALAAQLNAAEARAGRLQNQIDNLLKPMRDKAIAERDAEKARADAAERGARMLVFNATMWKDKFDAAAAQVATLRDALSTLKRNADGEFERSGTFSITGEMDAVVNAALAATEGKQ